MASQLHDPWVVIQQLEADNSRLRKEEIIESQAIVDNQTFFQGVRMALDSFTTFGVKKVPTHGGPDGQGLPWAGFLELAESLARRDLTGHAARDAIELALTVATQDQWNLWYRRILIKDLRCGVSEKTVNKVLKDYPSIKPVPIFSCQLAHDGADHPKKLVGKKLLEYKGDGVRVLTVINAENSTVTQYSRNGLVLENFEELRNQFQNNIHLFERSVVLDGEVMSTDFQTLMKQVHRKSDVNTTGSHLLLFDVIPLFEFQIGASTLGQKNRSRLLQSMKPVFDQMSGMVKVIDQIEVDLDTYVGQAQYDEFSQRALSEGFEGIMVKDPRAVYQCKRSHAWLKVKPVISVDLSIVALEEGTGRNQGRLGALVCEGTDNGRFIRVNVGSGLSDEQRAEMWATQNELIGQVVEIKADCLTQSQDSQNEWSLRFPRFERFRGFKAGEKI